MWKIGFWHKLSTHHGKNHKSVEKIALERHKENKTSKASGIAETLSKGKEMETFDNSELVKQARSLLRENQASSSTLKKITYYLVRDYIVKNLLFDNVSRPAAQRRIRFPFFCLDKFLSVTLYMKKIIFINCVSSYHFYNCSELLSGPDPEKKGL